MSNVFQFPQPKNGDQSFMMCSCNPQEPEPYMVVVIVGKDAPLICGLLCPLCETQLEVVNGFVRQPI